MLTCPHCQSALYPHLVRRTDEGWRHVRCPHSAVVRLAAARKAAERLEDLRWMAETGETLAGAAQRLGTRREALERWIEKHAPELQARFATNRNQPGRGFRSGCVTRAIA